MSATDELRRMLDERGVGSYTHEAPAAVCLAFFDGKRWHDCWESTGGEVNVTFSMTPEQAIAATLGSSSCSDNCTNSERTGTLTAERVMAIAGKHQPDYCSDTHVCFDWQAIADELNATLGDVPRLPHFWTHDGTLHIEATRMPTRIVVCEGGTCEFVPKRELDASEAENAKLRELVDGLEYCVQGLVCDCCPLYDPSGTNHRRCESLERELGVEVDE